MGPLEGGLLTVSIRHQFSSVQSLTSVQPFVTPWTAARNASLSITNSQSLLKLKSIIGDAIQPSHPLLSPSHPPSIFLSIRIFSNESLLRIRWSKYWSFSCSISPFKEYSGLISFRMDRFDLLAVQGTLKGLLQHHSSKASILQPPDFFIAQLSHIHDYWKNQSFDQTDLRWQDNVSANF